MQHYVIECRRDRREILDKFVYATCEHFSMLKVLFPAKIALFAFNVNTVFVIFVVLVSANMTMYYVFYYISMYYLIFKVLAQTFCFTD